MRTFDFNISDRTKMKKPDVSIMKAKVILVELNTGGKEIDLQEFRQVHAVELEPVRFV